MFYKYSSPTAIIFLSYTNSLSLSLPQALSDKISSLSTEEKIITTRQAELKKELYGRFGDSINLET